MENNHISIIYFMLLGFANIECLTIQRFCMCNTQLRGMQKFYIHQCAAKEQARWRIFSFKFNYTDSEVSIELIHFTDWH